MSCSSATTRAARQDRASDGVAIDLRTIRSPIVIVFARGDNITPPQQALGWILDLYARMSTTSGPSEQTIVYTIHDTRRHLGHLSSLGRVAKKEHNEFAQQYRPDRPFAPRTLGSHLHAQGGRCGQSRSRQRRLDHALRRADLGGHPRAWRPRARERPDVRDRCPALQAPTLRFTGPSRSPSSGAMVNPAVAIGCEGCIPYSCNMKCGATRTPSPGSSRN